LVELDVHDNQLTGVIPANIGQLPHLSILYLQDNQLTGPIPSTLGNLAALTDLNLGSNQLTGQVPASLGNLERLQSLVLYENDLTGGIPSSLGNLSNLVRLDLGGNPLAGVIPSTLGQLLHLSFLELYNDQLTGAIPSILGNLAALTYLDLRGNQLAGEIPPSLGDLSQLQYLYLYSNALTGGIPSSLGNLRSLTDFRVQINNLSGGIPSSLGNLANLTFLDLRNNDLTGPIPGTLDRLSQLQGLYLFSNSLSGAIPVLSRLAALTNFYLDHNDLDVTSEDPIGIKNLAAISNMTFAGQNVRYTPQNPPAITAQSPSLTNRLGGTVKFSVTATGAPPFTYQWQFDGGAIGDATNSVLALSHLQIADAGTYSVVVSNPYNTVSGSNDTLTIPVPAPEITWPANRYQTTNGVLTVRGTAAGKGLTAVMYQLNGGLPQTAHSTNLWSNWTASISLAPGTNLFSVVSVGPYSSSAAVTNRYTFTVTSQLTLMTNGFGRITPKLDRQFLDVGHSYTLTAAPDPRNVFVNWSGGTNSTGAVLTFVMQSNMVLEANFATNIFLSLAGTYNGLFSVGTNITGETAGMLSDLVLETSGAYSASLLIAGANYHLSGSFDSSATLNTNISRPPGQGGPLALNLAFAGPASPSSITGSVSGTNAGGWIAGLTALPSGNPTAAARYTMLIAPDTENDSPPGTGCAIIANRGGSLTLAGALADGTPFSQSVPLGSDGRFPLYASLYNQTGLLFGWINLAGETPGGSVRWLKKPSSATPLDAGGFTNNTRARVSVWTNLTGHTDWSFHASLFPLAP
jgi:Leucine-rich repeat (LRR) protein